MPPTTGVTHTIAPVVSNSTMARASRPVVTNRVTHTQDTAAVNALAGANAARQRAIRSGNKQAIANATANVKRAQSVVASRNRNAIR